MEVTINADTVIRAASLLAALGAIGGAVLWCAKFVERQKRQDKELAVIREEQCLICFSLSACLDGLIQLGANHTVPVAKERLDKYLNEAAHQAEVS